MHSIFLFDQYVQSNMPLLMLLLLSHFSRVRFCATPQMAAHQAPPSLGFSRQEHGVGCHFLLQCMKGKREGEIAQLCPTVRDLMDCSLPGSSAHGIFQARVLEWVAIAFSEVQVITSKIESKHPKNKDEVHTGYRCSRREDQKMCCQRGSTESMRNKLGFRGVCLQRKASNEVVLPDFIQLKTNKQTKNPAGPVGINANDTGRKEPSFIQGYLVPSGQQDWVTSLYLITREGFTVCKRSGNQDGAQTLGPDLCSPK